MGERALVPTGDGPAVLKGRYVQRASKTHQRWWAAELDSDEELLAWLEVTSVIAPEIEFGWRGRKAWRFVLTTERAALVAFGARGRCHAERLPDRGLHVSAGRGRLEVQVQDVRFRSSRASGALFRELAPVVGLEGPERVRAIARLHWVTSKGRGTHAAVTRELLRRLAAVSGEPLDRLAWLVTEGEIATRIDVVAGQLAEDDPDETTGVLQRLIESDRPADVLGPWARRWQVSSADLEILLARLLEATPARRAAALALPLHRQVREARLRKKASVERGARWDLDFAAHLQRVGRRQEAVNLLRERLALLPPAGLRELSPPSDQGQPQEGRAALRVEIMDALLAAGGGEPPEPTLVVALARAEPLRAERLQLLESIADESLQQRIAALLGTLEPAGLEPSAEAAVAGELQPIDGALLEERLPHPAARQGGWWGRMQQWLGRAKVPDYGTIKSYSERASPAEHGLVIDALADAALAFGVDGVEAYVSRGDAKVGIRAFDAAPPFVLVGVDHLREGSDVHLGDGELRFVLGVEVAALRFRLTRLSSAELWSGVFHRGKQVLEAAALLAGPLGALGKALRGAEQLTKLQRGLSQVGGLSRRAADVLGIAKELQQLTAKADEGQDDSASDTPEEQEGKLLAVCRAMQLTADRAGLVLSGDIRAAMRAILLSTRASRAELPVTRRHGLAKAMQRRTADGALPHPELALRLTELGAFYLSDDYARLRESLTAE